MTKDDLDKYHEWANDKIYLTDCDGRTITNMGLAIR